MQGLSKYQEWGKEVGQEKEGKGVCAAPIILVMGFLLWCVCVCVLGGGEGSSCSVYMTMLELFCDHFTQRG